MGRRRLRPAGKPEPRPALEAPAVRRTAFDLLSRKAWSGRELVQRLRRRGAPDAVARAVVGELEARGYVDDAEFARSWAATRARTGRAGRARLQRELRARGIAAPLVSAAIEAAFEEAPEAQRALEAGRRRLPALRRAAPERAAARLRDYLLRRGYAPGVVAGAVSELTGRVGDDPGLPHGDDPA